MPEASVADQQVAAPVVPGEPQAPEQKPADAAAKDGQNVASSADAKESPETVSERSDPQEERLSRRERQKLRIYRQRDEARAEAAVWKREVEALRAAQPQPADPSAPKLEQFNDIEAYAEAKAKYEAQKTLTEHQQKAQAETSKQAVERLKAGWEEKAEAARETYEDFDEVVGEITPTQPWSMAIMHADNGPDVAHHLGKNLKDAQRIAQLPPVLQVLEIGKLSAKLAAQPPKPKTPSQAPAPISPLTGNAGAPADSLENTNDIGKWIKARQKQVHARR